MPSSKRKQCVPVDHVKRPANSFMIWSIRERSKVSIEYPGVNNSEISKILGNKWKALSIKERQKYKDKAYQVKLEHQAQFPNYIFRPTKKQDKKQKKVKQQTYISLILNANKKIKVLKKQANAKNDNLTLMNLNDHWINYKEDFNYYETIELFYSTL